MRKPSTWTHKKYSKKTYRGVRPLDANGERVFMLKCNEKKHRVTFESWQAAKKLGWVKK